MTSSWGRCSSFMANTSRHYKGRKCGAPLEQAPLYSPLSIGGRATDCQPQMNTDGHRYRAVSPWESVAVCGKPRLLAAAPAVVYRERRWTATLFHCSKAPLLHPFGGLTCDKLPS